MMRAGGVPDWRNTEGVGPAHLPGNLNHARDGPEAEGVVNQRILETVTLAEGRVLHTKISHTGLVSAYSIAVEMVIQASSSSLLRDVRYDHLVKSMYWRNWVWILSMFVKQKGGILSSWRAPEQSRHL